LLRSMLPFRRRRCGLHTCDACSMRAGVLCVADLE
jgi:hypothetical protein